MCLRFVRVKNILFKKLYAQKTNSALNFSKRNFSFWENKGNIILCQKSFNIKNTINGKYKISKSFLSIQLAKRTHLLAHPWVSRGRHLGLDGNAGLVKDLGSGGPAGAYGPDGAGGRAL